MQQSYRNQVNNAFVMEGVLVHLFWLDLLIGCLSESYYEKFGTQTLWKLKKPKALALLEPLQLGNRTSP